LNLPYVLLNRQECAVLGSAIIAGYAVGLFDSLTETARRFVQPVSRVEPRKEYYLYYQPLVKQYIELFDRLRDSFRSLADLPEPPEG
jgi:xylulokinase